MLPLSMEHIYSLLLYLDVDIEIPAGFNQLPAYEKTLIMEQLTLILLVRKEDYWDALTIIVSDLGQKYLDHYQQEISELPVDSLIESWRNDAYTHEPDGGITHLIAALLLHEGVYGEGFWPGCSQLTRTLLYLKLLEKTDQGCHKMTAKAWSLVETAFRKYSSGILTHSKTFSCDFLPYAAKYIPKEQLAITLSLAPNDLSSRLAEICVKS